MSHWLRATTVAVLFCGIAMPCFAESASKTIGILVVIPESTEPKVSELPGFPEQAAVDARNGEPWTDLEVTQVLDGYRPVYQYTRIAR